LPKEKEEVTKAENKEVTEQSPSIIPPEVLENIPEKERDRVKSFIEQSMTITSGIARNINPIANKITQEHITKIIDYSNDEDKRDREERKGERWHNYLVMVTALVFTFCLILIFKDNSQILIPLITGILAFAGGFGIGKYYRKNN